MLSRRDECGAQQLMASEHYDRQCYATNKVLEQMIRVSGVAMWPRAGGRVKRRGRIRKSHVTRIARRHRSITINGHRAVGTRVLAEWRLVAHGRPFCAKKAARCCYMCSDCYCILLLQCYAIARATAGTS